MIEIPGKMLTAHNLLLFPVNCILQLPHPGCPEVNAIHLTCRNTVSSPKCWPIQTSRALQITFFHISCRRRMS